MALPWGAKPQVSPYCQASTLPWVNKNFFVSHFVWNDPERAQLADMEGVLHGVVRKFSCNSMPVNLNHTARYEYVSQMKDRRHSRTQTGKEGGRKEHMNVKTCRKIDNGYLMNLRTG
jgi:hypothetical protein